jgi:hypothetical protein
MGETTNAGEKNRDVIKTREVVDSRDHKGRLFVYATVLAPLRVLK